MVEKSITIDEVFAVVRDGSIIAAVLQGRVATAYKCGTRGMNRTVIEKTWP